MYGLDHNGSMLGLFVGQLEKLARKAFKVLVIKAYREP